VIPIKGFSNQFLDDLISLANLHDKITLKQDNDLSHFEDIYNPKILQKAAQRPKRIKF